MVKRYISIPALIIAVVISGWFILTTATMQVTHGYGGITSSIHLPDNDTAFGGLFAIPNLNDSLPHYEYRRLEDSIKRVQEARERENKSMYGKGFSYGLLGVFSIDKTRAPFDQEKAGQQYYLALNNYNLHYDTKFFVQNGTFNLAYVKWDSVVHRKNDSTRVGHYERKQIPVRYATGSKQLLFPISKKQYNLVYGGLNVLIFAKLFVLVYIFLGLPVQILINISKGRAFNTQNIRRFHIMAWASLVIGLLETWMPTLMGWLFNNLIPDDFERPAFLNNFLNNLYLYLLGIALFIVARAFLKGYHLQQEQELTI